MKEKENAKDKLIKTASKLFQLQGYHGTGLNQILKESGAPKGSLYYHFPGGKEQLALESVQFTAQSIIKQINEGLNQSTDPIQAIQGFINDLAERFTKESAEEGIPIAAIALETSLSSETLRKACQTAYGSYQDIFSQKLIDAGFKVEKARELGVFLNALIEGSFLLSFTTGTNQPLQIAAEQIPTILKGS
ncbi:putative HTH-type transcriptional regulator YxaF [Paraliobacillus sp. PM-2]|uniref:TetR/AcrR family transcriptional regulator n=1 Tax=Paraliobacillus sp. PM-2 TaxID=1462524 RepID=UPI00061BCDBD|nr:TetR/AcrR family transcriptional regulator [Paraliobacillus sp. PM-2]CQR47310.1 putative HTH-type transcriptional regulator YxaF [Paraliobacillus sp. PM-2]